MSSKEFTERELMDMMEKAIDISEVLADKYDCSGKELEEAIDLALDILAGKRSSGYVVCNEKKIFIRKTREGLVLE